MFSKLEVKYSQGLSFFLRFLAWVFSLRLSFFGGRCCKKACNKQPTTQDTTAQIYEITASNVSSFSAKPGHRKRSGGASGGGRWECGACTFLNSPANKICTMCAKSRDVTTSPGGGMINDPNDTEEVDERLLDTPSPACLHHHTGGGGRSRATTPRYVQPPFYFKLLMGTTCWDPLVPKFELHAVSFYKQP